MPGGAAVGGAAEGGAQAGGAMDGGAPGGGMRTRAGGVLDQGESRQGGGGGGWRSLSWIGIYQGSTATGRSGDVAGAEMEMWPKPNVAMMEQKVELS